MILQMDAAKNTEVKSAIWLWYVLIFKYIVIIYRRIDYPDNGRSKIYGVNEYDKLYLGQKTCMICTE